MWIYWADISFVCARVCLCLAKWKKKDNEENITTTCKREKRKEKGYWNNALGKSGNNNNNKIRLLAGKIGENLCSKLHGTNWIAWRIQKQIYMRNLTALFYFLLLFFACCLWVNVCSLNFLFYVQLKWKYLQSKMCTIWLWLRLRNVATRVENMAHIKYKSS